MDGLVQSLTHKDAPIPSVSSGFDLMNNEIQDPRFERMQTGRVNNENFNLIDDMISHDEIYSKAGVVIET
jgi:hypothetical protein